MTPTKVVKSVVSVDRSSAGTPEIIYIHYDLWVLRITLTFADAKNPTYVLFEAVEGFRVLDEGQLLEFWQPEVQDSWLFSIESGGWLSHEQTRLGAPLLSAPTELKEYLVAGVNDCVSVIAYEKPSIITAAP